VELTDAQKTQVKDINKKYQEQRKALLPAATPAPGRH